MKREIYYCPSCRKKYSIKKIHQNHFSCPNPKCTLHNQLIIHGELSNTGKVSKLFGWVQEPGAVLKKKYKIESLLGKGGFGATYLAKDLTLFNQLRAVKETPREYCDEIEDKFLTHLDHVAIPKLYERFNIGNFHYIVMEFVEGISLTDVVRSAHGKLKESELQYYIFQLLDVLNYIHSKKIIHRDLKPDNILVRNDKSISLIDFGISKQFIVGQGTRHLARAASHHYSSPEQYKAGSGSTDFSSDIYSFGAILYFMTTGLDPVDALSRNPVGDISPLPRSVRPDLSLEIEKVIIKAMKMNKAHRFSSFQQISNFFKNRKITAAKKPALSKHINTGKSVSGRIKYLDNLSNFDLKTFVNSCYQNWNVALKFTNDPNFVKILRKYKMKTLANLALSLRKNQTNKHIALQQFLMSTGYGKKPVLNVSPGKFVPSSSKSDRIITISNEGEGTLYGKLEYKSKFISSDSTHFLCLKGGKQKLKFKIARDANGTSLADPVYIHVKSNAGSISVPVILKSNTITSTNSTTTRNVEFKLYKGEKYSKYVKITPSKTNKKSLTTLTSLNHWMHIKPSNIKNAHKRVKLSISTRNLDPGRHQGTIKIVSDNQVNYLRVAIQVLSPSVLQKLKYMKPIAIFVILGLLIRYIGPVNQFQVSSVKTIILTTLLFALINLDNGKAGIIFGSVFGICVGVLMNMIIYYLFPIINDHIIYQLMNMFSLSNSIQNSYVSWGGLGAFIGIIYISCMTKSRKIFR